MNILLLGSTGQLGKAWTNLSHTEEWPRGFQLIAFDRARADLSEPEKLLEEIQKLHHESKLSVIINAAAYTQVDQAETDRKNCRLINSLSPANLAEFCFDYGIVLIHYSSDYVYSGEGSSPHHEEEERAPINYYGMTKAEADAAIEASGAKYLTFRTSWVYSSTGKNFVLSMLKLASEREQLKIVNDQVGAPTYAPDLALYSLQALKKAFVIETVYSDFPSGVYHLCNLGETSWFNFAQEIFKVAQKLGVPLKVKEVLPISSSEFPTPAKRPLNSKLSLEKIEHTLQITPRTWKEALGDCLDQIQRNAK